MRLRFKRTRSPTHAASEDLVLLKMVFHRARDLEDVRRLLVPRSESLDVAYLREWMTKTLEPEVARELHEMMTRAAIAF
jgi:hypothetical protein